MIELDHNRQNIRCPKDEVSIEHSTVKRWFKKFCLGYKNLTDWERFGRPKTMNFVAISQAIKTNPSSSTRRIFGKLSISV